MTRRLLAWCLLAYPHRARERDGAYLLDLAEELAARSGGVAQMGSLLRGGLAERARLTSGRRVLVGAGVAVLVLVLGGAALATLVGPAQVEVEACAGADRTGAGCDRARSWAEEREQRGWRCEPATGDLSWQCERY